MYQEILEAFGWDEADDAAAAHLLKQHIPRNAWASLGTELKNRPVATVVGRAPSLEHLRATDLQGVIVAADGAVTRLRQMGVVPRVVVTDLDGAEEDLEWAADAGASIVVHAHGHNQERLAWGAGLSPFVVGTYQSTPSPQLEPLRNLGGFTDGDRAVSLCAHYKVRRIHLVAFDLAGQPVASSSSNAALKARKLGFARRIIDDLAKHHHITGDW